MAQSCPLCGAAVTEEQTRCSDCGAELDPYGTIGIPKPKARPPAAAPSKPPKPSRPVEVESEPGPIPAPAPVSPAPAAASSVAPREERPPASKPSRPRPKPAPAPAPPPAPPPPPAAAPSYPAAAPAPAPGYAYPSPPPSDAPPGGIRKWMIKMLGGQAEAEPPAGYPSHPAYPQPAYAPPPQAGWAPGSPPSQEAWPVPPGYPPPYSQPSVPAASSVSQPMMPPMPAMGSEPPEDDEAKTQYMPGADIGKLKFPTSKFTVQLLDNAGQWRPWAPIGANGLNLGRSQNSAHFPFLSSMATRHVRFSYDGPQLRVEDLGSLNGVYLKITRPVELKDGTRFRVGSQVIEFREAAPLPAVEPLQGPDGEEFLSADISCPAVLVLIRPNNEPGLVFPMTKPEATRIGRDGKQADIALTKAEWVSSQHALIRQYEGRFYLEDTNSRNGTFVQLREPSPIESGDILLVGRAFLRVVDQAGTLKT